MKYLFILLLLVNILFYLWVTGPGWTPTRDERVRSAAADGLERIVLVSEQESSAGKSPGGLPPAAAVGPADVAPAVPPACLRVGPFETPKDAQLAAKMPGLDRGGVTIVKKPTEVVNGYLILYPPAADPESARATRKMLVERGFTDAWVVEKGENLHAIVLAIVGRKEQADEAFNHFRAQGIPVEPKPRLVTADRWWLETRTAAGQLSVAESESQVKARFPDARFLQCE